MHKRRERSWPRASTSHPSHWGGSTVYGARCSGEGGSGAGPITSWEIDGETVETVADFIFLGSKITADGNCSHEIYLDSILKSRGVTLPTKVHLVQAMVFPSGHVWM